MIEQNVKSIIGFLKYSIDTLPICNAVVAGLEQFRTDVEQINKWFSGLLMFGIILLVS